MPSDFLKRFKYNIGAEEGNKAAPKTYDYTTSEEHRKADMRFDFNNINGDEAKETVYNFIVSLTEDKINELISRNFQREQIQNTDANEVTYQWEYLPYHYNETWEEYLALEDAGLLGMDFIYFIYQGYTDESGINYDDLTYEALKEKYPTLPNYQTRPNEPNMNELIYKIGLLERRSSNLESVIINEESQS